MALVLWWITSTVVLLFIPQPLRHLFNPLLAMRPAVQRPLTLTGASMALRLFAGLRVASQKGFDLGH